MGKHNCRTKDSGFCSLQENYRLGTQVFILPESGVTATFLQGSCIVSSASGQFACLSVIVRCACPHSCNQIKYTSLFFSYPHSLVKSSGNLLVLDLRCGINQV